MPVLRKVTHTDELGRKAVVMLPEQAPDSEAEKGVLVGPPRLDDLGLPVETEVRLNNELFGRGILTAADAVKNSSEVVAALQAALKVDAGKVIGIYIGKEKPNGHEESTKEQSNKSLPNRGQSQSRKHTDVSVAEPSTGSELGAGGPDADQDS